MLNFLFKLAVLIVVLFVVSQLEYKGRKVQTYAEELFKSSKGQKGIIYIEEERIDTRHAKPSEAHTPKVIKKRTIKLVKEPENGYQEISEQDRKELMDVFE